MRFFFCRQHQPTALALSDARLWREIPSKYRRTPYGRAPTVLRVHRTGECRNLSIVQRRLCYTDSRPDPQRSLLR
jgi:hypothetical protein